MNINAIFGAVALAATLAAAPASAAVFSGSTTGCFGSSCSSFGSTKENEDLRFTGASFSSAITTTGSVTLGTFSLFDDRDIDNDLEGDTFKVRVDFTAPAGTSPDPVTFTALLDATIVSGPDSLLINFNNTPQSFAFNGGTFTLALQDVTLRETTTLSASLLGSIVVGAAGAPAAEGAVPEPSTWAMMILGFAGVGFTAYRRARKGGAAVATA